MSLQILSEKLIPYNESTKIKRLLPFQGYQSNIIAGQKSGLKTDTVAFLGTKLSPQYYKAQAYVDWARSKYESKGEKLTSLKQLDPDRLEGILDGIKVFENLKTRDLYLLQGTGALLTQRGCLNHCSHCYIESRYINLAENKDKVGNNVNPEENNNLDWEDFIDTADTISEINKRLGFNLFDTGFMNFLDSDPIATKMKDKKGQYHNYAEALYEFNKRTNLSTGIITAGYDENNEWTKQAAKELVQLGISNKDAIYALTISVNPFHKIMSTADKHLKMSNAYYKQMEEEKDPSRKKELEELCNKHDKLFNEYYKKYIDRMAKSIYTFLPLLKIIDKKYGSTPHVSVLYAPESTEGVTTSIFVQGLFNQVYNKLETICEQNGLKESEYSFIKGAKQIQNILNLGRSAQFFSVKNDKPFIKFDSNNGKLRIITEGIPIENFYKKAVYQQLIGTIINNNDSVDKVVIKINPIDNPYLQKVRELRKIRSEDNRELIESYTKQYISNMAYTIALNAPLFAMDKAEIVVNYSPENGLGLEYSEALIERILEEVETLKQASYIGYHLNLPNDKRVIQNYLSPCTLLEKNKDNLIKFEELKKQDQIEKTSTKEEFTKIINALPPKAQFDFLNSSQHKTINIDGQLLFRVDDSGPLEDHFIALNDLKLKFQNPNKHYKHDNFKFVDVDRNAIQAPEEIKERDKEFDILNQKAKETATVTKLCFGSKLNTVA